MGWFINIFFMVDLYHVFTLVMHLSLSTLAVFFFLLSLLLNCAFSRQGSWHICVPWMWILTCLSLSSVELLSRVWHFATPWMQLARLPCPPVPEACWNSCLSSWWCHPTISSSVISFSCLQSFPASGSFQMSEFFTSGGQSIGASASVFPMNI